MVQLPPLKKPSDKSLPDQNINYSGSGMAAKEKEFLAQETAAIEQIRQDLELEPEVEKAGVEARKEEIEMPPPLASIVTGQTGTNTPPSQPSPPLPLDDDKIDAGLAISIWASFRWLAEWCVKQLKKAHIRLVKVHGQIVRIVTK